jgi:hypothetical protein
MKRLIITIAVIGIGLFLLSGCKRANSDGSMFRANLRHTGVYHTKGVPQLHGVKWRFKTGDGLESSPTVADSVVYFGSSDGYLYALH